jgi:hypothetical protein
MKAVSRNSSVPRALRQSAEVREWLRTQNEFTLDDFAEEPTAYNRAWRLENEQLMTAIESVKGRLEDEEDRAIADLYLAMRPREIAKHLGIPRTECYRLVRRMRRRALVLYKQRQQAPPRDVLPSPPAPVRTVKFSCPGQKPRTARLVFTNGEALWLDDDNCIFPQEIQDLLSELPELEPSFTVLDAEVKKS